VIWRPWRRIRELEARIAQHESEMLGDEIQMGMLRRQLELMADRYDSIRASNAALRQALALYRDQAAGQ
jgi:hypothetical protein